MTAALIGALIAAGVLALLYFASKGLSASHDRRARGRHGGHDGGGPTDTHVSGGDGFADGAASGGGSFGGGGGASGSWGGDGGGGDGGGGGGD